jgi:protoporphyrinogen oxidase
MHIGVLGGGAAGLTAAMRVARKGAQVTLIEKEDVLGGLAAGFKVGDSGVYLEKFYHHLFRSDKEIQALIEELGLGDKLEWYGTTADRWIHRMKRTLGVRLRAFAHRPPKRTAGHDLQNHLMPRYHALSRLVSPLEPFAVILRCCRRGRGAGM